MSLDDTELLTAFEETQVLPVAATPDSVTPINSEKSVRFNFLSPTPMAGCLKPMVIGSPVDAKPPVHMTNPEVRRFRMDIIRSSSQSQGDSHVKCQETIRKLKKRIVQLNLKIDKKDAQLSSMWSNSGNNEIASGLLKVVEKLQLEKQLLSQDLSERTKELEQCVRHGETLQQQLEDIATYKQQQMDYEGCPKVDDLTNEFRCKIEAYESLLKTLQEKRQEDQEKITSLSNRIENLSTQVFKLESEKEILRNESGANYNRLGRSPSKNNIISSPNNEPLGIRRQACFNSYCGRDRSPVTSSHRRTNCDRNYGWWYNK